MLTTGGYPNKIYLRGVTKEPHCLYTPQLKIGQDVWFEHEPDNPHDANALVVKTLLGNQAVSIGYVPRELTSYLLILVQQTEAGGDKPGYWNAHVSELLGPHEDLAGQGVGVTFWCPLVIPRQRSISTKRISEPC